MLTIEARGVHVDAGERLMERLRPRVQEHKPRDVDSGIGHCGVVDIHGTVQHVVLDGGIPLEAEKHIDLVLKRHRRTTYTDQANLG
jgi:hypothetical protein